jgi:hypothetical protein
LKVSIPIRLRRVNLEIFTDGHGAARRSSCSCGESVGGLACFPDGFLKERPPNRRLIAPKKANSDGKIRADPGHVVNDLPDTVGILNGYFH